MATCVCFETPMKRWTEAFQLYFDEITNPRQNVKPQGLCNWLWLLCPALELNFEISLSSTPILADSWMIRETLRSIPNKTLLPLYLLIYIHTPLFKKFERESLEVNPILQLT